MEDAQFVGEDVGFGCGNRDLVQLIGQARDAAGQGTPAEVVNS